MLARLAGLTAAGLIAACSVAPPAGKPALAGTTGPEPTTRDGAFTVEQAERGKRVYDDYCSGCHPAEFYEAQMALWENTSVGELFGSVSATMPSESPGALSTRQYLDVLAYILSITGSPAGHAELTLDNMDAVLIVRD